MASPKLLDTIAANPANPGIAWNPIEYPVNFCLLGGQRSPGVFEIDSGSFKQRWVRFPAPGMAGETLMNRGTLLTEFTGLVSLYDSWCWSQWWPWSAQFQVPTAGALAKALSFWHPLTQNRRRPINSVVIEEEAIPKQQDGGLWTVQIHFLQYWRPRPQAAKPDAPEPQKLDAVDQKISDQSDMIAELMGRKEPKR